MREEALADPVLNRALVGVREALEQDRSQLRFQDLRREENPRSADMVPTDPLARDVAAEPPTARSQIAETEPEAEAPAPKSPTAHREPMREDPDLSQESGAGGLTAEGPRAEESGAPAWAVPNPPDDEADILELRDKAFKHGQKSKKLDAK